MIQYAGREWKGAVFDLDGTILDSMGVWEKVDVIFLEKRSLKLEQDYLDTITPMGFKEAAEYTIRRYRLKEQAKDIVAEWFETASILYAHEVGLKAHAREYLHYLKERGVKIAAATSSEPELYEAALKNNNIYRYFDAFAHTSEVKSGKESPAVYKKAAEMLGLAPKDCIVYEDILKGIRSAGGAGFYTVAFEDSYSGYEKEQLKMEADVYITDYRQMKELE